MFYSGRERVEGKPLQVESTGKTGVNEQQNSPPPHLLHHHLHLLHHVHLLQHPQHLLVVHLCSQHLFCWQLLSQLEVINDGRPKNRPECRKKGWEEEEEGWRGGGGKEGSSDSFQFVNKHLICYKLILESARITNNGQLVFLEPVSLQNFGWVVFSCRSSLCCASSF